VRGAENQAKRDGRQSNGGSNGTNQHDAEYRPHSRDYKNSVTAGTKTAWFQKSKFSIARSLERSSIYRVART